MIVDDGDLPGDVQAEIFDDLEDIFAQTAF